MTWLLLAFLIAFLLGFTVLGLLRADRWSSGRLPAPSSDPHPSFIAEAVFSPRDWLFVRQESSADLNALFVHERRSLAMHWLRDCLAGIHAVRANHLRQSRHSQDLNVFAEAKLLFLFFYLSALCRFLIFLVQVMHPASPRTVALYIQHLTGGILPAPQPSVLFSPMPVREVSRERLG